MLFWNVPGKVLTIKFTKVIDFMLEYKAQRWEIPLNATSQEKKKKKDSSNCAWKKIF